METTEYTLHRNPYNPRVMIFGRILGPGERTKVGDVEETRSGEYKPVSLPGIAVPDGSESRFIRPAKCVPFAAIAHAVTAENVTDPENGALFTRVICTRCLRYVSDIRPPVLP